MDNPTPIPSQPRQPQQDDSASQQDLMMTGTLWFTLADVLSRLLGAIYIIPWYAWMGSYNNQANALFSMGYNIYALFLLISTAGIPVAIAREVAHYRAAGDEAMSYRLVRQTFVFMIGLGLVAAAVMYFAAPALAVLSAGSSGAAAARLIPVMRSLSLSILIFPAMSVIRGYFQGLNDMKPIALSQIYEQIVRVIWMLTLTFMIMRIGFAHGNWVTAVTQSTLAAFIGMLGSCVVLVWYLVKNQRLSKILHPGPTRTKIRAASLLLQTLYQAIPFIVIGSAIQIFKIVDQMSFAAVMHWVTAYSSTQLQIFFAYFSANTDKLTMILIGEAMTLGGVALPLITTNFVKRHYRETAHLISYDIQIFAAFMLPAVAAMVLLSRPIYVLFYGTANALQLQLFVWTLLQAILLAFYTMLAPILQAMHYSRVALKYFAATLIVKLLLQIPAIMLFHSFGPLVATTIAFLAGVSLLLRKIYDITRFKIRNTTRNLVGILILTGLTLVATAVLYGLLSLILIALPDGHLKAGLLTLIAGGGGAFAYLWMAAQTGLLEKLLGDRGTRLRQRLHL